jgi:peptide/nickel transport system substrate-binding protein
MPRAQYFPKMQRLETSMYMLGWGGANIDPLFTLLPILHSRNDRGDGDFNWGNYRDAELDALIDEARGEMDPHRRHELVIRALRRHDDMVYHVPIHLQVIPWAMRANVEVVHRADNWLRATWVKVK